MQLDRSAVPFLAAAWGPAALLLAARRPLWAAPLVALGGAFAWFFRDPDRQIPTEPHAVLAPADGRVLVAGRPEPGAAPPGDWQQIGIFLSPLDVHVNRVPVSGRVTRIDYRPGRFLPAYRRDAAAQNERNEIWLDHHGQTVVCRQVVGVLARRIVCRLTPGATVAAGARFGIMKFGSRMDVFLPPGARLRVARGQTVRAGETIVASLEAIRMTSMMESAGKC